MDLVRVPREEAVYEREAVLGRDTSSVFPKEAEKAKKEHLESIKKAVGLDSSKFISESQLEAIKKERGASVEDGTVARDKTLAAVLAENKAKKEEQFANVWKTMKQGKNRPLDEEEMAFMDKLADTEMERLTELRQTENQELAAFQEAVRRRAESQQIASTAPNPTEEAVQGSTAKRKPSAKLLVKVKPASKLEKQGLSDQGFQSQKRLKVDAERPLDAGSEALTSLFSDYASDSEQ